MKRTMKLLLSGIVLCLTLFLCSCKGDVKIKLQNNGTVSFQVTGSLGDAFLDLLSSNLDDKEVIDTKQIKNELMDSGFSNVRVSSKNGVINISFLDEMRDSYLFNSGLIYVSGNELKISITPKKFLDFYNSCGEEIQMILDLFLSPVLNDEVMSEEEYVDTMNVTYGEETGEEVDNSVVYFTVTDKKGNNKKKAIFLKSILCGEKFNF